MDLLATLARLGVPAELSGVAAGNRFASGQGATLIPTSPIDGATLPGFSGASPEDTARVIDAAARAFVRLREIPAPRRGELVRRLGLELRRHQDDLATLVSWEVGKIRQEARGEVQEMIDICDFAAGLSRQLYGNTIASERPQHRLTEQWHPLGPIGVITAFNFPVAVWAWNAAIAVVAGDPVVWKPSEKAPLCALACQAIASSLLEQLPDFPRSVFSLIIGDSAVGHTLAAAPDLPLISATGSVAMGRNVAQTVAARLGRSLLELGGNNAMIVTPSADPELTLRSIVFAAVGTCGQRCTTLRRLIVQRSMLPSWLARLKSVYAKLPIGDPFDDDTLVGPLIDEAAYRAMQAALDTARAQGGVVQGGRRRAQGVPAGGVYVEPALVEIHAGAGIVREETFAPILYVMPYDSIEDAIALQNSVSQGLASAIMTHDVKEAELFCSASGSDCGIVNVNLGTSGAEIGGAFGGEKATGGGRESGSDAWKAYMRRATSTINYSDSLPLAQGIRFEVETR